MFGIATLVFSAFMTMFLNSSVPCCRRTRSHGAFHLGSSGEPLLDGSGRSTAPRPRTFFPRAR